MNRIMRCDRVSRIFNRSRPHEVWALTDVNMEIERGSFALLRGPSGSGKTTLLGILGALDRPSSGAVYIDGVDASSLSQNGLASLRKRIIGLVFQTDHLIRGLPAWENVALPLIPEGVNERERKQRAGAILSSLGLGDRSGHRPEELSVGERQRVAMARALINDPEVLILDEPTAALDEAAAATLVGILTDWRRRGKTIVVSSHDDDIATYADEIYELRRGVIAGNRREVPVTFRI